MHTVITKSCCMPKKFLTKEKNELPKMSFYIAKIKLYREAFKVYLVTHSSIHLFI